MNQTRKYVLENALMAIEGWIRNHESGMPHQNSDFKEKIIAIILEYNILKDELQAKLDEETNDFIRA